MDVTKGGKRRREGKGNWRRLLKVRERIRIGSEGGRENMAKK